MSKNIRIAPVYAITQKGHLGSRINSNVEIKEIKPFDPPAILLGLWTFLQQVDFMFPIFL
ncbi:MAG: hypothetical protein ABJJ25_08140 [Eudoraea sp.]|uniref:hypothetical protein n=1 Tax=Eudoraea sp. TaxID=1979955 RepID=UPI0032665672